MHVSRGTTARRLGSIAQLPAPKRPHLHIRRAMTGTDRWGLIIKIPISQEDRSAPAAATPTYRRD